MESFKLFKANRNTKTKQVNKLFYGKSTTQNFQTFLKLQYNAWKKGNYFGKDMLHAENPEETVLFNMRDIIEEPMHTNDLSNETYEDLIGFVRKIDGQSNVLTDWAVPYNSVYVETENTETSYGGFYIATFANKIIEISTVSSSGAIISCKAQLRNENTYGILQDSFEAIPNDIRDFVMSRLFAILQTFRKMNNTEKNSTTCFIATDEEAKPQYVKTKNKEVKKVEPKPTYIVLSQKDTEKARRHSNVSRGTIKYSFSWLVRGHYRNLHNPKHYGRDRFGNYNMLGRTWIAPYTKGDKTLPLKNTEKIVLQ